MKKGNDVRITKFGECANPKFTSADIRNYKHGVENEGVSLPVDYWVEGTLLESISVGRPIMVARRVRNGISVEGIFQTSSVTEIEKNGAGICDVVETQNSKYMIEILP